MTTLGRGTSNDGVAGNTQKSKWSKLPLIRWLQRVGYAEAYETINPQIFKPTWTNYKSCSKIDHIWLDPEIKGLVMDSDIEHMDLVTGSDHNLIWTKLLLSPIFHTNSIAEQRKKYSGQRKIYQYDKMTNEDWENFTSLLEKYIEEFQRKELKKGRDPRESSKINWINEVWEKLAELICQAANKSIPHKKIKNTREEKQKQIIWNPRYKWIKQLRCIERRG